MVQVVEPFGAYVRYWVGDVYKYVFYSHEMKDGEPVIEISYQERKVHEAHEYQRVIGRYYCQPTRYLFNPYSNIPDNRPVMYSALSYNHRQHISFKPHDFIAEQYKQYCDSLGYVTETDKDRN